MRILKLVIFCFLANVGLGQNIAIENSRAMNIIYPWSNPLTIVVENVPCSNLFVKTDNGSIQGNNCNYTISPETVGRATLSIYQINGTDTLLLGEKKFRVKRFPLSKPYLGVRNSGLISLPFLKAQLGVMVRIENFDINASVRVKNYRISIIRKDDLIKQFNNEGPKFTTEVREYFKSLKSGDKIFIDKVFVRTPGVKDYIEVDSSEFIIE